MKKYYVIVKYRDGNVTTFSSWDKQEASKFAAYYRNKKRKEELKIADVCRYAGQF